MIKAVVFDLDDTLISEMQYIESGYKKIAIKIKNDYRLEISEYEIYSLMIYLFKIDSKNVFNRTLEILGIEYTLEYIKELVNCYRNHIPEICFFKEVIPCLNNLKQQKIKLGLITDGYKNAQKNKLKVLNAKKIFDKVILTDELGKEYWKPNPKAFKIIKDYFNIKFEEIIYVGDNPEKDFYIKRYCPINCVRIYRNESIYKGKKYRENIKENYRISNLNQIINIIKEINT